MSIVQRAAALAYASHSGQSRKYTGRPYIEHPMRVAGRVTLVGGSEEMIAAAWLHDVLEDTGCERWRIEAIGSEVLYLVEDLTNPSKGLSIVRAERKKMDREKLVRVSQRAQVIKLFDRYDNLLEMDGAPKDFMKLYCHESRLLLEAIGGVDLAINAQIHDLISMYEGKLAA